MPISEVDSQRISQAVRAVEARSAAEIVCVLSRSSADYAHVPLVWAGLAALVLPAGLIALTELSAERIYLAQIALFVAVTLLLSHPAARAAATPKAIKRVRADRAALEQFHVRGLTRTQGRTGVLIFVSLLERRARIIADDGVAEKLGPDVWREAVDLLVERLGRGDPTGGFVAAIEKIGPLLAEHVPVAASDEDELPNRIHLI